MVYVQGGAEDGLSRLGRVPTVGLCLGPYGGPGGAVSYETGTPVGFRN